MAHAQIGGPGVDHDIEKALEGRKRIQNNNLPETAITRNPLCQMKHGGPNVTEDKGQCKQETLSKDHSLATNARIEVGFFWAIIVRLGWLILLVIHGFGARSHVAQNRLSLHGLYRGQSSGVVRFGQNLKT